MGGLPPLPGPAVYKHIYATKRDLAPFEDRVAMAKLNFESLAPNVKVLRLEEEVVTAALQAAIDEGGCLVVCPMGALVQFTVCIPQI